MEQSQKKIFVHLGTFNGAIIGFEGNIGSLENIYAYTPNMGAVKCVSTSGRFLLTGGFDEIIRIYDLKKKKEMGQLVGHEGTITCLRTYKNFVISGGEDGNIIIWKTKEWSLLHKLKGHKDSVHSMSLHSSAKILASVGKDKKIILWNMVNGTKLFRKTLAFNAYKVDWSLDENSVLVMSDFSVHMLSQETNASIKEFKHSKRINDFIQYNDFLIVAGDDGLLYFWNNVQNAEEESFYIGFKAHTPRVKKVEIIDFEEKKILISCSTDGVVSLWDLTELLSEIEFVSENKVLEESLKPIYTLTTFQRIISLHVHESSQITAITNNNDDQEDQAEKEEEENSKKQKLDKKSKKIKKVKFAEEVENDRKPKKNHKGYNTKKQKFQQKNNSSQEGNYEKPKSNFKKSKFNNNENFGKKKFEQKNNHSNENGRPQKNFDNKKKNKKFNKH